MTARFGPRWVLVFASPRPQLEKNESMRGEAFFVGYQLTGTLTVGCRGAPPTSPVVSVSPETWEN